MYVEGNLTAGRLNITGVASDRASDQHVAVGGGALVGSLKCAHVSSCDISAVQEDPKLQEMAVALWDLQMQQQENKGDLSNLLIFFFLDRDGIFYSIYVRSSILLLKCFTSNLVSAFRPSSSCTPI